MIQTTEIHDAWDNNRLINVAFSYCRQKPNSDTPTHQLDCSRTNPEEGKVSKENERTYADTNINQIILQNNPNYIISHSMSYLSARNYFKNELNEVMGLDLR